MSVPTPPAQKPETTTLDRALAWAVLGLFVAECLTGIAFYLLRPVAAAPFADLAQPRYVSVAKVMGHFHGLFALAFLFAAPFAVVRAVLWKRRPGGRAARTAAGVAFVALALALAVPTSFTPWDTVFEHVADWLHIYQGPAPRPFDVRYDARELLSAGRAMESSIHWRLYLIHGMAAPLALICLLSVGAHKLRKRV